MEQTLKICQEFNIFQDTFYFVDLCMSQVSRVKFMDKFDGLVSLVIGKLSNS